MLGSMEGPDPSAEIAERDARIWLLRIVSRWMPADIAEHFGITRREVDDSLERTTRDIRLASVDQTRLEEIERLDALDLRMQQIADATHPVLYKGEAVEGVSDTAPVVAATRMQLEIAKRRAQLTGADAPVKVENHNYEYTVNGVDVTDLR